MEVFGVRALWRTMSAFRGRSGALAIASGLLPLALAPPAASATTILPSRIAPGWADLPQVGVFVAAVVMGTLAGKRRSIRAMLAPDGRSRLRGAVESRMLAMTFWDACGQISEPNDAFLELIGYTRADLRLHPVRWQDITPLEYLDAAARAAAELHAGGRCAPFEMEYLTKAGRRVPILVGAALLEGDEKGAVSFALDLTERRRGGARMSQAECVMDEYLATSAHELRNALGPLANALDVARRDLPESRARALAMASRQVTVLSRLVDDLLDVSRAGHGMTILCKEPMALRSTIEQVAES